MTRPPLSNEDLCLLIEAARITLEKAIAYRMSVSDVEIAAKLFYAFIDGERDPELAEIVLDGAETITVH